MEQVLHFCINEKFNSYIVNRFEEINFCKHTYVICSDSIVDDNFENPDGQIQIKTKKESLDLLKKFDNIVFHCATPIHLELAEQLSKNHSSCLISWGASKYDFDKFGHSIYEPITLKLLKEKSKLDLTTKDILYNFITLLPTKITNRYYRFKTGENHPLQTRKNAFSKFSFITTIFPEEFNQMYGDKFFTQARYLAFTYSSIKALIGDFYGQHFSLGKNIIVGHSGFLYNNQIDAFRIIKDRGYTGKVIVPLNYAKDKWGLTKDYGKNIFGNQFISPDYLEKNEYFKLLTSCNAMVLYNRIQQGTGNLFTGLYIGMRVYLNDEGLLYEFCKKKGFKVFSFQKEFDPIHCQIKMSDEEIEQNRQAMENLYGENVIKARTLNFIQTLISHKA
jgi:hypothetical protein